jgi:hypothetical protein
MVTVDTGAVLPESTMHGHHDYSSRPCSFRHFSEFLTQRADRATHGVGQRRRPSRANLAGEQGNLLEVKIKDSFVLIVKLHQLEPDHSPPGLPTDSLNPLTVASWMLDINPER